MMTDAVMLYTQHSVGLRRLLLLLLLVPRRRLLPRPLSNNLHMNLRRH